MKVSRCSQVLFCALLISSSMASATPWSWAKNKMGSVWFTYKTWNIPRPRLIDQNIQMILGKQFIEFRYDLSRDSGFVKNIRKKLQLSGIYLSDNSDIDLYKKHLERFPIPTQYVENGFDIAQDNSVGACMGRLLDYQKHTVRPVMTRDETEPFIQLLWEIENSLPMTFDRDEHGRIFVDFIRKMIDKDIPEVKINKENKEESFMSIFLSGFSDSLEQHSRQKEQEIGIYLSVWRHYSLRFRNNKGLDQAIKYFFGP